MRAKQIGIVAGALGAGAVLMAVGQQAMPLRCVGVAVWKHDDSHSVDVYRAFEDGTVRVTSVPLGVPGDVPDWFKRTK